MGVSVGLITSSARSEALMRTAFVLFGWLLGSACLVYAGVLSGGPAAFMFMAQQGTPPATGAAIGLGVGGGLCLLAAGLVLAFGWGPKGRIESNTAMDRRGTTGF